MKYGGRCEYLGAALPHQGAPQGTPPTNFPFPLPSEHAMSRGVGSPAVPDSGSSDGLTGESNSETEHMSPALLRDLELMHYYTAYTCLTISDLASFNHIWQEVIPWEAQSHPFLMYGILALAALHLGHDRPQRKGLYTAVALRYYNVGIASFRAALKQVTADNSTALFGFSAILIVLSLALAQSHPNTQDQAVVEELIQIFTLLQGVRVVLESVMPWVEKGPLGPLLQRGTVRQNDVLAHSAHIPRDFDEALSSLSRYNERRSESVDSHEMYKVAIQALRDCLKKIEANPGDRAAALNWLVFLESSYVSSLKSNQPLALVILAHYGVVLHGLREHWFVQDFGIRMVEMVHLSLTEEWRSLVHWPMKQVGLKGERQQADERIEPG
jgi:hypothetical protein